MADVNYTDGAVGAFLGAVAAWFGKRLIGEDVQMRLAKLEAGRARMQAQLDAMKESIDRLLDQRG